MTIRNDFVFVPVTFVLFFLELSKKLSPRDAQHSGGECPRVYLREP